MRDLLSSLKVKNLKKPGLYGDGNNLYLRVTNTGTKSWIFRYKFGSPKQRSMGLGPYPEISLADARDLAIEARRLLIKGVDPLSEKRRTKHFELSTLTFKETTLQFIEANKSGWTPKHAGQVENTLKTYTFPKMCDIPIASVTTQDVLDCVSPIWEAKNETANRVRGRIEAVLDYATAMGLREGDNPARWRGHLSHLLPKRSAVAPVQHLEALPYQSIPEFMEKLKKREGYSPRALEFTILTAMRVGAVVGAQWDEFTQDTWTIPAGRMKGQTTGFKVPLSKQAQKLLETIPQLDNSPYVFPGKDGKSMTIASPLALLKRRMGYSDLTVHGFRSTFRDWAAEQTSYAHHIQEMALAHTIDSKVERAYRRGDLFAKRARLMQEWANYLDTVPQKAETIPINAKSN